MICKNVISLYVVVKVIICLVEFGSFIFWNIGWSICLNVGFFSILSLMDVSVMLSCEVDKYLLRFVMICFVSIVCLFFFRMSWLILDFFILMIVNLFVMKNVVNVMSILIKIKLLILFILFYFWLKDKDVIFWFYYFFLSERNEMGDWLCRGFYFVIF